MKTTLQFCCSIAALALSASPASLRAQAVPVTLHSFAAFSSSGNMEGQGPQTSLVRGKDGNLYGATGGGGNASRSGTIYRITPAGGFTVLHQFTGADGSDASGSLLLASDGNFYGTTYYGGNNDNGTVYRITPAGALTTIHDFSASDDFTNADGAHPDANLIPGSDGNFYSTCTGGGSEGYGTIFKITPAGVLTTLHNCNPIDTVEPNQPESPLVLGGDGNFYSTSERGGKNNYGTVFRVTPAGALATLHSFTAPAGASQTNADGATPAYGLTVGGDGNFYGVTGTGGSHGRGTVYRITPAGAVTTLHSFAALDADGNNADGSNARAGLVRGADGNFYGSTYGGGTHGKGTLFRITPGGVLTNLHSFTGTGTEGGNPTGNLLAGGGYFYGTTINGGTNNTGTVFRLSVLPAVTSAATATATQGKAFSYKITATNAPTRYSVLGLPPGLHVDATTGVISGTPTALGKKMITLKAVNVFGTGQKTLTLTTVQAAPVITSPGTATATVGKAFSYKITATNSPTRFGVVGLPPGLKVDAATGVISGTPTKAGMPMLTLKAINGGGTGQKVLTLTVKTP